MEIRSLATTDFDTLFRAFSCAFADYDVQLDAAQLAAMLKRRGFNSGLSFAAFEGDEIISFTCNGIGNFNSLPTAYDTGTGTLKEYRGKGLATRIFEYSIPFLKKKGIEQYLLEVLQHNTKAVSVYRNIGFEVSREFNYYMQKNGAIHNVTMTDSRWQIERLDVSAFDPDPGFWDFHPSWQNSTGSIKRASEGFVCLGAFSENQLAGYCIFEPVSGDITQIAVDRRYRRKGIASLLLKEMLRLNKNNIVKVVNTDITCDSITRFLEAKHIEPKGKQFEMVKKI